MDRVETFLSRLREAQPEFMDYRFRHGGCYQLFLILQCIWPDAKPWYAWSEGHIYTKIGPWWYDIRGKHVRVSDPIAFEPYQKRTGHRWLRAPDHHIEAIKDIIANKGW